MPLVGRFASLLWAQQIAQQVVKDVGTICRTITGFVQLLVNSREHGEKQKQSLGEMRSTHNRWGPTQVPKLSSLDGRVRNE